MSRIRPSFFFHILAYFFSFLKGSLKEGEMKVNFFFFVLVPSQQKCCPSGMKEREKQKTKNRRGN